MICLRIVALIMFVFAINVSCKQYLVKLKTSSEESEGLENKPKVKSQVVKLPQRKSHFKARAGDYNDYQYDDNSWEPDDYNVDEYDMKVIQPNEYMMDLYFDPDGSDDYGKTWF